MHFFQAFFCEPCVQSHLATFFAFLACRNFFSGHSSSDHPPAEKRANIFDMGFHKPGTAHRVSKNYSVIMYFQHEISFFLKKKNFVSIQKKRDFFKKNKFKKNALKNQVKPDIEKQKKNRFRRSGWRIW